MHFSYLSLALYAVLAAAAPAELQKRGLIIFNTPVFNGETLVPGTFYKSPFVSPGFWAEGPNTPICSIDCLNPAGSSDSICKKPGCARNAATPKVVGINPNAVYVNKDRVTGRRGNEYKLCPTGVCLVATGATVNTSVP